MRKNLKILQTGLGEKIGLSRQTISLIERKQLVLTWNNYLAIMMFFRLILQMYSISQKLEDLKTIIF